MTPSRSHFESVFGELTTYVLRRIDQYGLKHRLTTTDEHDKAVLDMVNAVYNDNLPVAGPARHPIWEKGWADNLAKFDAAKAGRVIAKPSYYGKYPIVRWMGDLYIAESTDYEHNMLALIQDWLFDKYLHSSTHVFEFGCGTGHNLFRVRDVNPSATLVGMDWAESAVKFINLQATAGAYGPGQAYARQFNYFNPDTAISEMKGVDAQNAAFLTIASMEQIGSNWKPFYDFVMQAQPGLVVHVEPIDELLDNDVLLDHLSLGYSRRRGYLSGWLRHLKMAEELGKIRIIETLRTKIGSKFLEGYSVVVWQPV